MLLENPAGPYPVGATTFTLPVRPTRVFGTAAVRTETGQIAPALRLEEVSFTAYYPVSRTTAESRWKKWLDWFPRPLADAVRGYSRYAGISSLLLWPLVFLFGWRIQVPAFSNAPPLRESRDTSADTTTPPWPLVIFSHGLGGGGTTYSQVCTHLASSGKVVLAMEHRDGTSPVSRPRSDKTGQRYSQFYINPGEVVWDKDRDFSGFQDPRLALRAEQLELRKREIYLAYSAFQNLVQTGRHGNLRTMDDMAFDWASWSGDWVQCDEGVSLVGHSFGGATVFAMLSDPSPREEDVSHIPVSHALVLDPWLEPIPSPGPEPFTGRHSPSKHRKLMVINSEGFTLWEDHFKRVEQVVPAWPGSTLLTIVGARHVSFSDFPIMLPRPLRSSTARPVMDIIQMLALSFLDNTVPDVVSNTNTRKLEIKYTRSRFWSKKPQRRLVGRPSDIIIHRRGFDVDVDTQAD
ncbi:platelet-activating factor acetylhydrolase [Lactifluus subvellereus]|nr:platelet-activating factor acetylhydrolase [Lactifluus subvellereus]